MFERRTRILRRRRASPHDGGRRIAEQATERGANAACSSSKHPRVNQPSPTRDAQRPGSSARPRRSSAGRSPGSSVLVVHLPVHQGANSGRKRERTRSERPAPIYRCGGSAGIASAKFRRGSPASRFTRRARTERRTPADRYRSENVGDGPCIGRRYLTCCRYDGQMDAPQSENGHGASERPDASVIPCSTAKATRALSHPTSKSTV